MRWGAVRRVTTHCAGRTGGVGASQTGVLASDAIVLVLSRSFSSPLHIPNVSFSVSPVPGVQTLGSIAASKLVLSPNCNNNATGVRCRSLAKVGLTGFGSRLVSPCRRLMPDRGGMCAFGRV